MQVEAMLEHDDARVRANAVEALGLSGVKRQGDRLEQMSEEDAGRPRANALGELIRTNGASAGTVEGVRRMLHDEQVNQRISALWLVETLGIGSVLADVSEMMLSDQDVQVRTRAARTVQSLFDQMKKSDLPQAQTQTQARARGTAI
jgi:HEAT repeat protein